MTRKRSTGRRFGGGGRLACALLLALPAACGDRERPTGLPTGPVELLLSVTLLSPEQGTVRLAGTTVPVTVQASESAGRLTGVGYEARLTDFEKTLLDSAQVEFGARPDTTVTFEHMVPEDFRNNVQIDFFGVAYGPEGKRLVSVARSALIIR